MKYSPLIDMNKMFSINTILPQLMEAVSALSKVLDKKWPATEAPGNAFEICTFWQNRFHDALCSPIPDNQTGLSAFRCITDYVLLHNEIEHLVPPKPTDNSKSLNKLLRTAEDLWHVYHQYLEEGEEQIAGKQVVAIGSEVEQFLLSRRESCTQVLGGQAGNAAWLWHVIGTDPLVYSTYISKGLVQTAEGMPSLKHLRFCQFKTESLQTIPLCKIKPGIQKRTRVDRQSFCGAPSGSSFIVVKDARRLILQFEGFRDLENGYKDMPFNKIQICMDGQPIYETQRVDLINHTWPQIGLFSQCWIESASKTLIISLISESGLRQAFEGKVNFAVIGGLDTLFHENGFETPDLREQLIAVARNQLEVLARASIKIGIELSRIPNLKYLEFLRDLCKRDIVVALGVNGLEELPLMVHDPELNQGKRLFDVEHMPYAIPASLLSQTTGDHFEYLTYLRALGLAKWLDVRYLYVHTNNVDLVLQRGANEADLRKTQSGCMKGKGWVIGALSLRCWPDTPYLHINKIPPAVKPEGMSRLASFVMDIASQQSFSTEQTVLMMKSGISLAESDHTYSVAAIPVMWPSDHPKQNQEELSLPLGLNTTGAGDMTFAAFMFFGISRISSSL